MNKTIITVVFFLASLITMPIFSHFALSQKSNDSQAYILIKTPQNPSPKVSFPTKQQLTEYYDKQGKYPKNNIFTNLYNSATKPNDIHAVAKGNHIFIAWISPLNKTNSVLLTKSHDHGQNFSIPKQLNNPHDGNVSNLQMAITDLSNQKNVSIGLAWQEIQGNQSNVIASTSMNSGDNFKTFKLNKNNTYATDPLAIGNGDIQFIWLENNNIAKNQTSSSEIVEHCCGW